jgi:hypothetical protein
MASKRTKRASSALDAAMAALAASAVAFVVYAMPDREFGALVEMSGLPQILPAAQPPLGTTARFAALAAAGAATFALVWLVLRALAPKKKPASKAAAEPVEIELAPKLRRADAHPDAPSRRPIFAGHDLGEPAYEDVSFTPLADEAEAEVAAAPEPEPEPAAADVPEEERPVITTASVLAEPEPATIPELMQRLELGLLRRQPIRWPISEAPKRADAEQPLQIDARLRTAIEDLQQLARRG